MTMSGDYRPYIVRQGDYLARLAHIHGFDAGEVWNHEQNAALRELGRTPDVLAPGDVLYLPVKPKEGLAFSANTSNRYQAEVPKVKVSLIFKDDDRVLSDEPYEVHGLGSEGSSGQADERKTDADGRVNLELPVTAREVTVVFPRQNVAYEVRVGDMDPEAELSGIKKRLENLGFLVHEREGASDDEYLRGAVASFQKKSGLPATGTLDDATKKALKDAHGL
jgi:hypothetical protein